MPAHPHDHTRFLVDRLDPALSVLTAVEFMLRSAFEGSDLFHGVHGEGYFHYRPRNFVESEISGVSNPPSPIVDHEQPTPSSEVRPPERWDPSVELTDSEVRSGP